MEIGHLGLDGNPGSGNGYGSISQDGETSRQKWVRRCEGFKQEGSMLCGDDVWRTPKVAKPDTDLSPAASTALLLDNSCGLAVASDADKLSVSCNSKPESSALAYFHHIQAAHTKNAGYYYSGGMNTSNGMYLVSGVRGPFTPSQWLELEQQALIYKYMKENEPVPLHLLIPIVKAFESAGWFGFNGGACRPNSWGMGPFHLAYSNSTDPEPGRCRRTDGKKWRCARDAVVNQKYCERHMNRGRHRSRKHVEGQGNGNGNSVSGATKPSTTKLIPPSVASSSADPLVLPGNCPSNSFDINQHHHHYQAKSLQPLAPIPNTNAFVDRMQGGDESTLNGTGVPSQSPFDAVSWKTYGSSAYNPADFMSSTSSRELEMGLGVGFSKAESHEQANWTPISYGPLGEALQCSSSTTTSNNMFPQGWEYGIGSCQLSSLSPTGVLQRSGHTSLSNSSAGSSPRADNSKAIDHSCSLQGLNLG